MYPGEFDLYKPADVQEALSLLREHSNAETELLAGGHSLIPDMKTGSASPDVVIDIGEIDRLSGIEVEDDTVVIGATTTYSDIIQSAEVEEAAPALADAVGAVGDTQVRNRGTIGGNVANADPDSDLPAGVLAADATFVAEGPDGERKIPASEFFVEKRTTSLKDNEILTHVEVPESDAVGSYVKKTSPSSGYALVGVATQIELDDGTIESATVAANGARDYGVRLQDVEGSLVGNVPEAATFESAAAHATDDIDINEMRETREASGRFRENLLEVYTRRALETATERAGTVVAD
jgi:carbon-monoxide dehydrogenase medium subunit